MGVQEPVTPRTAEPERGNKRIWQSGCLTQGQLLTSTLFSLLSRINSFCSLNCCCSSSSEQIRSVAAESWLRKMFTFLNIKIHLTALIKWCIFTCLIFPCFEWVRYRSKFQRPRNPLLLAKMTVSHLISAMIYIHPESQMVRCPLVEEGLITMEAQNRNMQFWNI